MTSRHGHKPHHKSRLSPGQRIATYAALGSAWVSGATWLLFHYFLQRQGDFGLEPNPLEHWWLRLHGLCAFALLSLSGLVWVVHARPGMRWPRRRPSGVAITISFCVLVVSGYCLYYVDDGAFRDAAGVVHWIFGLSLAVPVALHAFAKRHASLE